MKEECEKLHKKIEEREFNVVGYLAHEKFRIFLFKTLTRNVPRRFMFIKIISSFS